MIDDTLLSLVRCPVDGQTLLLAPTELTEALNQQISLGQLRDRADGLVDCPLEGALMTADGSRAYPIRDHIPTLIPNEAIPIPQALQSLAGV